MLAESAAISSTSASATAAGRLSVAPDQPNYPDYLYWMHFNNNVQGMFFAKLAAGRGRRDDGDPVAGLIKRREDGYYRYLDQQLGESPVRRGSRVHLRRHHGDVQPDVAVALRRPHRSTTCRTCRPTSQRITQRPAYVKAMKIAGRRRSGRGLTRCRTSACSETSTSVSTRRPGAGPATTERLVAATTIGAPPPSGGWRAGSAGCTGRGASVPVCSSPTNR